MSVDLDRFIDHRATYGIEEPSARIAEIVSAIEILAQSLLIGHKARGWQERTGDWTQFTRYLALYCYLVEVYTIFVLALRAQSESGFKRSRRSVR